MNRPEAAALAVLVRTQRPEWDEWATIEQLVKLPGSLIAITRHAITVAHDPQWRSPIALGFVPMTTGDNRDESGRRPGDNRPCWICTRTEWACERARTNTGINDHHYQPTGLDGYPVEEIDGLDRRSDTELVADVLSLTIGEDKIINGATP